MDEVLTDLFEKIKAICPKRNSVAEIQSLFSQAILGHTRPSMKLDFEGLYRGRIITQTNPEHLKTAQCIWYPHWEEIPRKSHSMGRCNDKGQSLFYASNCLEAIVHELNPKDGDLFLVGDFGKRFSDVKAVTQFAGIDRLSQNNIFPPLSGYKFWSDRDKRFEELISDRFTKSVVDQSEYKESIAFSNILFNGGQVDCLVYPSVASDLRFWNVGILPCFVDQSLICRNMIKFRVKRDQDIISLTTEEFGILFSDNLNPKLTGVKWMKFQANQVYVKYYKA